MMMGQYWLGKTNFQIDPKLLQQVAIEFWEKIINTGLTD